MSFVDFLNGVMSFSIFNVPFIVMWLGAISIYLTVRLRFINILGLKHALDILCGKFNGKDSENEIKPFQALMSSMAATIGTGSIVGVAVAVSKGGPGSVFWMMVFGFFGMTVKCVEVFLGHKYRRKNDDGSITGGPFIYLQEGLKEIGMVKLGVFLSVLFAVCGFFGILGMAGFQSNQIVGVMAYGQEGITYKKVLVSLCVTLFCAYILLGGLKRISSFADKMVPFMIVLYVGTVSYIMLADYNKLIAVFKMIFQGAFDFSSGITGFFAIVVIGARRALMASEVGLGTSPIINATSNVKYSQRQGIINLFDPFITTWFVCLATALVVIMSGFYNDLEGVELVQKAFALHHPYFKYVMVISILFFALTTVITCSYYFEKVSEYLKISNKIAVPVFFLAIFVAGIVHLDAVLTYTDLLIFLMVIINTFGILFMMSGVSKEFYLYFKNIKNS